MPSSDVVIAFFALLLCFGHSKFSYGRTIDKPPLSTSCRINLKSDLHRDHPPMLVDLSSNTSYYYPSANDPLHLTLTENERLGLFCPRKSSRDSSAANATVVQLLINNRTLVESSEVAPVTCRTGQKFELQGNFVDFVNISCHEAPRATYNAILRENNEKCTGGRRYEIGYYVGRDFLRTIELCHDKTRAMTLWAKAIIVPVNRNTNRHSGNRQSFKTGILYDDMRMGSNDPYNLKTAYETLRGILGKTKVDKYLSTKIGDRKFLAKGHLIASADKLYKSEQDSTMFYANVVPMWQQINSQPGNWYLIEDYVRLLSAHKGHELEVWAGGVGGTLKLNEKIINIYRHGDDLRIPVPKLIFKCAIDKTTREAICFVVVNNPYVTRDELADKKNNYVVCKKLNTCDQRILGDGYDDVTRGYAYCCELSSFFSRNRKELGLDGMKEYVNYDKMALVTRDKERKIVAWSKKDGGTRIRKKLIEEEKIRRKGYKVVRV